jgi:hypothetical protein
MGMIMKRCVVTTRNPMQTLRANGMLTILVAAFVAAACSEMTSPTKPGAPALAPEQSTQASDAAPLAAVRQATAAFHDVDKAMRRAMRLPWAATVTKPPRAPWVSTA